MRHDAQLDLRIVGREERVPWSRDERFADAPAFAGAHGNVLEIRLEARETPGHRGRLREVGMDPTGCRVDHLRELVGISRFELR